MPIHLNNSKWRQYLEGMASVFDIFGASTRYTEPIKPKEIDSTPSERIAGYWQTVGTLLSKQIELLEANGAAEFQKEQRKI